MYFLNLKPSPNLNVTQIHCGTSSPRLSGSLNLSLFPNITDFACNNNDIVSILGYDKCTKLRTLNFALNKVTGQILSLENLTALRNLYAHDNLLTGSIPSLSVNLQLRDFIVYTNQLTGSIPNLNNLGFLSNFNVAGNQLTGIIPSLSANTGLIQCYFDKNQFTGFAGGPVSSTLGTFQAQNNQLTSIAVNSILAAFVAANRTSGTRILNLGGTGNAAPTGQGITDKATLISRGWTVTTN